jgi:hypothetical protein
MDQRVCGGVKKVKRRHSLRLQNKGKGTKTYHFFCFGAGFL